MRTSLSRAFLALLTSVCLMSGVGYAKGQSGAPAASETPDAGQPLSFTYLGQTFAVNPHCDVDRVIVGTSSTVFGATVTVMTAVEFPGGFSLVGPHDLSASGAYAGKAIGDDVCLNP